MCYDDSCPNNSVTENEVKRLFAIFITTKEGQEMEKDTDHKGTFTTHGIVFLLFVS